MPRPTTAVANGTPSTSLTPVSPKSSPTCITAATCRSRGKAKKIRRWRSRKASRYCEEHSAGEGNGVVENWSDGTNRNWRLGRLDRCRFFLRDPSAPDVYTLSLHDALPI